MQALFCVSKITNAECLILVSQVNVNEKKKRWGLFQNENYRSRDKLGVFHFKDNNKPWVHISCHHTHIAPTSEMKNLCIFGQPLKISSFLKAWDKEMCYTFQRKTKAQTQFDQIQERQDLRIPETNNISLNI